MSDRPFNLGPYHPDAPKRDTSHTTRLAETAWERDVLGLPPSEALKRKSEGGRRGAATSARVRREKARVRKLQEDLREQKRRKNHPLLQSLVNRS